MFHIRKVEPIKDKQQITEKEIAFKLGIYRNMQDTLLFLNIGKLEQDGFLVC